MKMQKYILISLLTLLPCVAGAQMFNTPTPVRIQKKVEPIVVKEEPVVEVSQVTAEDILKKAEQEQETNPNTMITAEERAAIQKPVIKSIMKTIDRASPKERRDLINIMKKLQEASTRRQNLRLPANQQLDEKADLDVNTASSRDVQKYMIQKVISPINRITIVQEDVSAGE